MLLAFLSFIVGIALLVLVFSVLINRQKGKMLNIYLLLALAACGIQHVLIGVEKFGLIASFKSPLKDDFYHHFFILVLTYLFYDNLLNKTTPFKKVILHLIFPILFTLFCVLFSPNFLIIKVILFLFDSLYVFMMGLLIWKHVYKRKNYKELIHYQSIRTWALFTYSIVIIFYFIFNFVLITTPLKNQNGYLLRYYDALFPIWVFFIFYILKNPVILYGEQLLLKNLKKANPEEVVAWRSSKLEPTEAEDLELEKKVKSKVDEIIFAIKKYEEKLLQDLVEVPTLKELAFELDYPQSHLKYVFNYYSFCSYSEYQNNLKIKYALKLIKSGYLDTRTIDSLATRCLFANRRTFYRNFNKWVGFTPTEYLAQISSAVPLS
jgi:AraC-like DNA-binding protein